MKLPKDLKQGLTTYFVADISEVHSIIFQEESTSQDQKYIICKDGKQQSPKLNASLNVK